MCLISTEQIPWGKLQRCKAESEQLQKNMLLYLPAHHAPLRRLHRGAGSELDHIHLGVGKTLCGKFLLVVGCLLGLPVFLIYLGSFRMPITGILVPSDIKKFHAASAPSSQAGFTPSKSSLQASSTHLAMGCKVRALLHCHSVTDPL